MKVISGGRCSGKTTRAVAWLKEDLANRVLVVPNEMMVTHVYKSMGVPKRPQPSVVSVRQVQDRKLLGRKVEIGVDNLDMILGYLLHQPVRMATMNAFEHLTLPADHTHVWEIKYTDALHTEPSRLVCTFPGCSHHRDVF